MLITVNGKTKELQNTLTIGQYLEENSYVPSQIAVELNERILSKAEYSTTVLHENDILEIVSFMGGWKINRNILISHYNIRKKDLNYEYK